jgi:hypothetical protein
VEKQLRHFRNHTPEFKKENTTPSLPILAYKIISLLLIPFPNKIKGIKTNSSTNLLLRAISKKIDKYFCDYYG